MDVRELSRSLPLWTIWYGEHTGRFWAMPKRGLPCSHIEALTPEELEARAWQVEQHLRVHMAPQSTPTTRPPTVPRESRRPGRYTRRHGREREASR